MALDHEAILRAYSGTVVSVDDTTNAAYDVNNNKVTLEQSKIDAARVEIDKEEAAVKYKKRQGRLYTFVRTIIRIYRRSA